MFARSLNVQSVSRSKRPPTLAILLAAAGLAAPAMADQWSWNAGHGNWMTASNWTPSSVPGVDSLLYTDVRIGNLPGVQNSTVLLSHLTQSGALPFDELHISSGMTLDTNGREIGGLSGITTLTGANSELIVRSSTGPNFHDFTTRDFTLGTGTLLNLADNGRIRVGHLASSGVIFGRGTVHVQGSAPGASLINNGAISGSGNGGLTILQEGTGRFDLDGASGNGQLTLAAPFSQLTFQGDTLADSFGGTVTMGSGSLLNINMSNGWTADASSTFNVSSSIVGAAAQIDGGHLTFCGSLNIGGSQGHLRVLADATMTNTAVVSIASNDRLTFARTATVNGGTYNFADAVGDIVFLGQTAMNGGTFNGGHVAIYGDSTWDGTVNINGTGRQSGNAVVVGATVINAGQFQMDGHDLDSSWQVNNALSVNANSIGVFSNGFASTMNIAGGVLGRLTINLTDPAASWTMYGTMNLDGAGALPVTRVAGSRMIMQGQLNVNSGIAQITADTAFSGLTPGTNVTIANGSTLRMRGNTTVDTGVSFTGAGTLQNGVGGRMLLNSGASLSSVGLINNAALRIGESGAGIASVDRFMNTTDAAWAVDIGGYLAGTNHDLLLVTGGSAMLNGQLLVSLLTGFAPQIGDEFTILSSLAGISGTFLNDPTSFANGLSYDWTVVYNPNTVVLRLDNIVPAPGSVALLGLGGLLVARRRRA